MSRHCDACNLPLPDESRFCPRCGQPLAESSGLSTAPLSTPNGTVPSPERDDASPLEVPRGWRKHEDPWAGFSVVVPERWRVACLRGEIGGHEDPSRPVRFLVAPSRGISAPALAQEFVQSRQATAPLQVIASSGDEQHLTLRFRSQFLGQWVDGVLESRLLGGGEGLVTGFFAPPAEMPPLQPILQAIVASYRPLPRRIRIPWTEPGERSFAIHVPQGWQAQGNVRHDPSTGLGKPQGMVLDPASMARVEVGVEDYPFYDAPPPGSSGMMGGLVDAMMGVMGGGFGSMLASHPALRERMLPFQAASSLIHTWLLPRWRATRPDLEALYLAERPDLLEVALRDLAQEMAKRGMAPVGTQGSVGEAILRFTIQGVPFLERVVVQTLRFEMPGMAMGMGMGMPAPWYAEVPVRYSAPRERFASLEPILQGVADSMEVNPAWKQGQQAVVDAHTRASQQDIMMRQRQISQTLSETSDIVAQGYWSREAIHQEHAQGRAAMGASSDWSQKWSDAMLGWEERIDETGQRYSIPAGHERVWRDNQGNMHTGNWLSNPDPTWHELKRTDGRP